MTSPTRSASISGPSIGSLCTGYGGLDMAVEAFTAGETVWHAEYEPAAAELLEARYPGRPNLGDITAVDWNEVEPVEVLTAGYPCQPFSYAGHREGENDERHLWPHVREAIRVLGPRLVVLENVSGHLTLGAASVVGELAELGLSVTWGVLSADAAGAPHTRRRLFILAADPDADRLGLEEGHREPREVGWPTANGLAAPHAERLRWGPYLDSIRRWELRLGRPVPPATEPNRNGSPRFTAELTEWLMGLPSGWVTDSSISYASKIQLLGNGVCPQQALLALELLVPRLEGFRL